MSELVTLIQASAHYLPMIPAKSVQCIVTSPPYMGLRAYEGEQGVAWDAMTYAPIAGLPPMEVPAMTCALGHEPTIEAFIGHLVLCAREWRRVLKDDGTVFCNLGDSYSTQQTGNNGGIPNKNLMMIPARFALAAQADGWVLRSEIVWHKPNPMPESVTDRPTKAHEQIYLLAKSERYFYDAAAVRERSSPVSGGWQTRSKNGLTVKGNSQSTQVDANGDKVTGMGGVGYGKDAAHRNLRSVWTIATQPFSGAHFAAFPEKLVEPMIKAGSRAGDTVLDPFSGSGTTGRVAVKLGRRYIGIDLSEQYLSDLAPQRLTVQMELGA